MYIPDDIYHYNITIETSDGAMTWLFSELLTFYPRVARLILSKWFLDVYEFNKGTVSFKVAV